MSTTQDYSSYSFFFGYDDPQSLGEFNLQITRSASFGDADAFALFAALKAAFPAALHITGSVSRSDSSTTSFTTDLASDPPAFT